MGHGEVLDVGYTSPIVGLQSQTVNAKLFLPTLFRAPASFALEAIADTVGIFLSPLRIHASFVGLFDLLCVPAPCASFFFVCGADLSLVYFVVARTRALPARSCCVPYWPPGMPCASCRALSCVGALR